MHPRLGLHQLASDKQAAARLAHAALKRVAHTQLAAYLPYIDRLAFVGEGAVTCDDEQRLEARRRGDDVLYDTVGKVFLVGIVAHVGERQYRDGRPVG